MGIFSGLFKSRDKPQNRTSGSGYSFFFGGSTAGKNVNERSAMQMTAVYSCVRILAEAVAGLPLHLYRYKEDGGKEKALDHPLYNLLHDEPNPEMSSFVFRETLMTHLLLWGNAYAQIIRNGKGEVIALYPLMPNRMVVDRDTKGRLYYQYTTSTEDAPTMKGVTVNLPPSDVLHIPGLGFDGLVGYSPIAMAKNAIGMAIACEEYGAKLIFTNNACYKARRRINPKGIMVHSTGANNPWLKRYVGPDDGLLGKNQYNNHWNQPMDREVCVHAFIGKLADGTAATYQTLPWDHRGWHAGGSANDTHISFEICEDDLTDADYLDKVYHEAVDLCVYLCGLYGLTEQDIICHCEGHDLGIASNHADVLHWWPKHGKNMDTFRAAVKDKLRCSAEHTLDNTPSEWSEAAVEWAVKNGLMAGNDNGNLMLRSPLTREQFCVILERYHNRFHLT